MFKLQALWQPILCSRKLGVSFHQSFRLLFGLVGRPVAGSKLCSVPLPKPLLNANGTQTQPHRFFCSVSGKNDISHGQGLPTEEQLLIIIHRLDDDLPKMFRQTLDYSLYHHQLVFVNNIRGTKTVGLEYFISTISYLRLMGYLKFASVKFNVLKITKHPEDGTVKIRWRIKGISGLKVFYKFWNSEQVDKENIETWYDGFSVLSLGSDGLIHKITADEMQSDNYPLTEDKYSLAAKCALI